MKKITLLAVLFITALSYGQELITDGGFEAVADSGTTNGTKIVQGNGQTPVGTWYSSAYFETIIGFTTTDQDTGNNAIILDNRTGPASSVKQNFILAAGTYVCSYRVKKVNSLVGDDEKLLRGYIRRNAGSIEQQINAGETGTIHTNGTRWHTKRSLLSETAYTTVSFEFEVAVADDGLPFHLFFQLQPDPTGSPLYIDNVSITAVTTWTGATDSDWATASNWTDGVPTANDNVTIPTGTGNNPIIGATTAAVANDIATNDVLTIANGGSLIVGGTPTGNVTYKRNLSFIAGNSEGWHLIGSPVVGQAYNNAYADANNIATSGTKRGIATYDNSVTSNNSNYLQSDDSNSGTFNTAQGYSVKTTATTDVAFAGTLNTVDVDKAITIGAGNAFNLISNPFTSYINSGTFLTTNTAVLTEQTIWLWNPTTKNYVAKVTADSFELAPGQGFFVSCGAAGNVTFEANNQSHQTDTFLRSASKSEITLNMTDGDLKRYAKIYYDNNATLDFDNGYDGETFSGVANTFDVFTQLIGNNVGKNYQLQSLPNSDLASMVIPVGLKAEANKEITFSAEAMNLPEGIKVFLEDRVNNTYTRLDKANATYKVTLDERLDGAGRFYIHTTQSALSIDNVALTGVSIFKTNASTLRVTGLKQGKASLSLFNVLGKQVMNTSFEANGNKDIYLPKLATGVYFAKVQTATGELSKKIILE